MNRLLLNILAALLLFGLTGCGRSSLLLGRGPETLDPSPEPLRIGVGWATAGDPEDAGDLAAREALRQLEDARPQVVFVWDNFPRAADSRELLSSLSNHLPRRRIYGGSVAWPMAPHWSVDPSVVVVALAGGWGVEPAVEEEVYGREREAGHALAQNLGLPATRPLGLVTTRPDDSAAPPGQFVVLFGECAGERGERLLGGVTSWAGPRMDAIGGSGAGAAGSGRQYVAGELESNCVWGVRLTGPFRVVSTRATASAGETPISESSANATTLLAARANRTAGAAVPWRLVLATMSSGWLEYLSSPSQLAIRAGEQFSRADTVALFGGWAGESQLGSQSDDATLSVGVFDLVMAVIEPTGPAVSPNVAPPATELPPDATVPVIPVPPAPATQPVTQPAVEPEAECQPPVEPQSAAEPEPAAEPPPAPQPAPVPEAEPESDVRIFAPQPVSPSQTQPDGNAAPLQPEQFIPEIQVE